MRFYPGEFRARYGDEMVQLFGDQVRDASASGRRSGPATVWLRTAIDLVTSATSEHLRRDRTMAHSLAEPPSMATRALGILGIVGGLVLISAWVPNLPWTWELFNLRLVLFNAGAIAIGLAIHRRQASHSPRLSFVAAAAMILANAWYLAMVILSIGRPVFPEPDPQFRLVFFYAGMAMWLSDAVFGLVALRLGVVPRWAASALMIGSTFALLGIDRLELVTGPFAAIFVPLAQIGIALNGFAWIALGLSLFRSQRIPIDPAPGSHSAPIPQSVPTPPASLS
ncbi:MAG TPA: hypothetical protein VEX41_08735 [Candidatus Eisenbacteria bacterium]|nr:hypothetical protein [Candidatus Eisenbacteria bacterium]